MYRQRQISHYSVNIYKRPALVVESIGCHDNIYIYMYIYMCVAREMYWTDCADDPSSGYQAKIEKASALDGSGRTRLVQSRLSWPNALAIDFEGNFVFVVPILAHKLGRRQTSPLLPISRLFLPVTPPPGL